MFTNKNKMKSYKDSVYLNKLYEYINNEFILNKVKNPLEIRKHIVSILSEYDHTHKEYYNFETENTKNTFNENFKHNIPISLKQLKTKYLAVTNNLNMLYTNGYLIFHNKIGIKSYINKTGDYIIIRFNYFNETRLVTIKHKDYYLEYKYNKDIKRTDLQSELYYSHKCECCLECEGIFEFNGNVDSNYNIIDNNEYKVSLNNCMFGQDYNMIGTYLKKYNCFNSQVFLRLNFIIKNLKNIIIIFVFLRQNLINHYTILIFMERSFILKIKKEHLIIMVTYVIL